MDTNTDQPETISKELENLIISLKQTKLNNCDHKEVYVSQSVFENKYYTICLNCDWWKVTYL